MPAITRNYLCASILCLSAVTAPGFAAAPAPSRPERKPAEVEALIKEAGEKPPDWLASVPLNLPKTLGLDWEQRGGKGWQPDVNMGAHMISRVYPFPDKWKYGIKLLTHAAEANRNNPKAMKRTCDELGRVYGDFLGDQPRAAYWFRQGGSDPVKLADCYRLMGCRQMAAAELRRAASIGGPLGGMIKIWGELGELQSALTLAQAGARAGRTAEAMVAAGNAYRYAGDYVKAVACYEQALKDAGNKRATRHLERARSALPIIGGFEKVDVSRLPDGTWQGECKGFRGPVKVSVTVAGGKITEAKVVEHREDWSGRSTFDIPRRIVEQNGIKGVDAVTRATTSSDAVINAAAAALKSAVR